MSVVEERNLQHRSGQHGSRTRIAGIALAFSLAACAGEQQSAPERRECAAAAAAGQIVDIPGGQATLGTEAAYREEGPPRDVTLAPFRMDATEVTNRQFAEFVAATGYVTDAEKPPPAADPPAQFTDPGSAVFLPPQEVSQSWWQWVPGANWRHPSGPDSDIKDHDNHPVVHISLADARAYAAWKGGALPTEDQWEYAARAGSPRSAAPVDQSGAINANHYQGAFPVKDTGEDGFVGSAPVGCYAANEFGLYDMIGNVWEWTEEADRSSETVATIKGGSYLCADNYCRRYRPSARQFQEKDLGTNHLGFRLVYPAQEQ